MELEETVGGMLSENYEERFVAEYKQLDIRLKKLGDMLKKYNAGELDFTPSCSYELLQEQYEAMEDYQDCLNERASIEGIEIEE